MPSTTAVVLAAGLGTRMKSPLPKVLHAIAGRPLVYYAVEAAFNAGVARAVVVTSGHAEIDAVLARDFGERVVTVVQDPPRGTGDAARIALAHVTSERTLIVYGDTPLVSALELTALLAALDTEGAGELSVLACELDEPTGYGRILRDATGAVLAVREERDLASPAERAVREVNAGMYAGKTATLRAALAALSPNNAQGEYYLTDVIAAVAKTSPVTAVRGPHAALLGVNDRAQLAQAEELMLERIRLRHARNGVTVCGRPRIDDRVEIAEDARIEDQVCLRGQTRIGPRTRIDVGSVLTDATIGADVQIKPYTVVSASRVGDGAQLGPFAHLRPESEIEAEAHIGNFVETKKTRVRRGAKANHLSYLGDGDVGERANIGAGTIFCNYDGFDKHRTTIGRDAFIGSDSQLVAPVVIGNGAYVATGTTVTSDVPDDALAIGRTRQINKDGYAPKLKARFVANKAAKKT